MKERKHERAGDPGRLRIAVDFDGVLFDHIPYMLRGFRDAYGIDLAEEGLRHWDIFQYKSIQDQGLTWNCVRKVMDLLETDPVLHERPPRDRRTQGVLEGWHRTGHEIHIVTARRTISREVTTQFLETNRIPHDRLVMDAHLKTGYDVLIDDAPHNVLTAAADGSLAILMDHPYNRDVPAHTNPKRAENWHHVERLFDTHMKIQNELEVAMEKVA